MAVPDTRTFAEQTADHLREQIVTGRWRHTLPPERELARELQVARNTLRKAILILRREGLLFVPEGRREHRIRLPEDNPPGNPMRPASRVVLLTDAPFHEMPPHTLLRVDMLRRAAANGGFELQVLTSRAFRLERPAAALGELTRAHPDSLWILHHSTKPIQRWFEKEAVQSLVFGAGFSGVTLPALSMDLAASMRHAMGMLLSHGHLRIALVESKHPLAGHLEARAALEKEADRWEGMQTVTWDGDPEKFSTKVKRLVMSARPPTAFVVLTPPPLLGLYSTFCHLGLSIPSAVSVVALFDDPILACFAPPVTHYRVNAEVEVKRLVGHIRKALRHGSSSLSSARHLQDFIPGGSVAQAPAQPTRGY